MKIVEASNRRALNSVFTKAEQADKAFERAVAGIVNRVRTGGDRALISFAKKFDRLSAPIEVTRREMIAEAGKAPAEVRKAIAQAAKNIARVAAKQIPKHVDVTVMPGVTVEQRVEPLARVGCYVPGGRFPLPSSLLMTAVPAGVAGVREVIAVCPRPEPAVMAAALEAGVTRLFRIGGAHAVAALAYGTETIPRVDKIVGPGNRWVARAKAQVSADCAIDFFAGPTEIVVVAAEGDVRWWAADLIAQAEHDPEARSIFITWNRQYAERVVARVAALAKGRAIVTQSLRAHGYAIVAGSPEAAMAIANRLAPEHLVVDREALINGTIVAGAIFVGPYTAQAAGDYATGSNHVLPTSGAARFRGGLSASDYVRVMAVQRLTQAGLRALAPVIVPLARAEGLEGHAESIEVRLR
jgi:histidinol dehydrogenase